MSYYIQQVVPYTPNGGGNFFIERNEDGVWMAIINGYPFRPKKNTLKSAKRRIYVFLRNHRKIVKTIDISF